MRPPKVERIHRESLLKLGEARGEEAEKAAGPTSRTAFLWRRQGPFLHRHTTMHAPRASSHHLPPPIWNSPWGPLHNQAHTGHPCTQPHPVFTSTQACTHIFGARAHAHTQGRYWGVFGGARQGGFSAVVAQEVGKVRPLLWERPCEDDGWGWVTGAQPQGNNLPGHLALLVPSRQCLPPVPLSST